MVSTLFIALLLTMMMFLVIESLRRDILFRNIRWTNEQLKEFTADFLGDVRRFDIFLVRQLRERIQRDFIYEQGIENFELVMLDSRSIKIAYQIEGIWEEIEISTEADEVELKNTELSYSYGTFE